MKKSKKLIACMLLITMSILMTACSNNSNSTVDIKTNIDVPKRTTSTTLQQAEPIKTCRANRYDMDLKLDTDNQQLSGTVTIQLTNETNDTLNELCLRTDAADNMQIQNVIIKDSKQLLMLKEKREISAFYVDISNTPLNPGESIALTFDFFTKIPKQKNRFGYTINGKDCVYQLTFCYPRIAMYEDGVWDESPYINDGGENNYTTVSDFHITFEAPKEYTVISSGEEKTKDNKTTITGENLRQLAIFAGTNIKVDTETVKGVKINNYYFNHDGNKEYNDMTMAAAKDSFTLFSTLIGEYPYQELDVVQGYYPSAMEYSGVILIGLPDVAPKQFINLDKNTSFTALCTKTAHEVAHQWFYGVVGNDPYNEPWLDESLAEYCEDMLFQQSKLPSIATAIDHDQTINDNSDTWGTMSDKEFDKLIDSYIAQGPENGYMINKAYTEYDSESYEYSIQVYDGGSYFFFELRKAMGDGVFFPMLQEYYKAYHFNECTTEEFINIVRTFDNSEKVEKILKKYIK